MAWLMSSMFTVLAHSLLQGWYQACLYITTQSIWMSDLVPSSFFTALTAVSCFILWEPLWPVPSCMTAEKRTALELPMDLPTFQFTEIRCGVSLYGRNRDLQSGWMEREGRGQVIKVMLKLVRDKILRMLFNVWVFHNRLRVTKILLVIIFLATNSRCAVIASLIIGLGPQVR